MNDGQLGRIVSAIREHTRAMVAERLWAQAEAGTDVNHVVADADALLAALSASKATTMDDLRETALRSSERINTDLLNDRRAELSASSGGDEAASGTANEPAKPFVGAGSGGGADHKPAHSVHGPSTGVLPNQAATPPLSAEAARDAYGLDEHETVTVRRDDLRMLLERHGSPRFPHAPEWLFRIREAVSR